MVAQNIIFGVLALSMCLSAIKVVTTSNVVHAALYLVVVLGGAAGVFILLAAEFLAAVQVLVYIGAIVVLFLFGIMLTRAEIGKASDLDNEHRGIALVVSLFLLGVLGVILFDGFRDAELEPERVGRTADVAIPIFSTYLVAFEVISVLLLAALVGAIVVARKD
ncbi:MAG: NADH-quinone oxidoreductase subunit J family protein [Acidimicrobiales bacterium]